VTRKSSGAAEFGSPPSCQRRLKPSIPALDAAGLPIRDELHLELQLR